jgi:hypothetical protein
LAKVEEHAVFGGPKPRLGRQGHQERYSPLRRRSPVGILHGCLANGTTYDESVAWTAARDAAAVSVGVGGNFSPGSRAPVRNRGCRGASLAAELTVTVLPVRRASLALHTYAVTPSFEAASSIDAVGSRQRPNWLLRSDYHCNLLHCGPDVRTRVEFDQHPSAGGGELVAVAVARLVTEA